MPSLQQYLEGKIVGLQTQKQHIDSRVRIQDFEGQKLVERIAHYAVIELAVRPVGHVSQNDADSFFFLV
jgi:ABC-type molybdate transport system ATPase subunit